MKIPMLMAIQQQSWVAFRNSQAQNPRFYSFKVQIVSVLLAVFFLCVGCVRLPTTTPEASLKKRTQPSQLIKVLPIPDSPEGEWRQPDSVATRHEEPGQSRPPNVRLISGTSAQVNKNVSQNEERQVEAAALELAKSLGSIDKIKMCYVDKDDEWWATLYEDIGSVIDVRQFIWNRESQRFEPFLVLKRISKSKLAAELKRNEKGRSCIILPPPDKLG